MSFTIFQRQMVEIINDLGSPFWKPVASEADILLREAIEIRKGTHTDYFLHWTLAERPDFVEAANKLKERFSQTTNERVSGMAKLRDANVTMRPSAIWLDGKNYRIPLARLWSYSPHAGMDLRWAAEITDFGRVVAGGARGYLTTAERKRFQIDAPSEYLAEKGMREAFEKVFRITLLA